MTDNQTPEERALQNQLSRSAEYPPAPTRTSDAIGMTAGVPLSRGVFQPTSLDEVVRFATLMAQSGPAVKRDFRDKTGICVALTLQALRWEMDPYALQRHATVINDVIAYEAKVLMAVVDRYSGLTRPLSYEHVGEGHDRRCICKGWRQGTPEDEPLLYMSPRIGGITPKNSPLWKTDPDQQLAYYAGRGWARRHGGAALLGLYDAEEAAQIDPRRDEGSPSIIDAIHGMSDTGFDAPALLPGAVEAGGKVGAKPPATQSEEAAPPAPLPVNKVLADYLAELFNAYTQDEIAAIFERGREAIIDTVKDGTTDAAAMGALEHLETVRDQRLNAIADMKHEARLMDGEKGGDA